MARAVFMMLGFLASIALVVGEATGKTYYRWLGDDGIVQLSDQPPKDRPYKAVSVNSDTDSKSGPPAGEVKGEAPGETLPEEDSPIQQRRSEVLRNLDEMISHYSDAGGITEGKLAALREAAEVVKNAKMDGGETDDAFYLKIEELVRAIKDHTTIIGRVHRLLNEAKAAKGLAAPQKTEESE